MILGTCSLTLVKLQELNAAMRTDDRFASRRSMRRYLLFIIVASLASLGVLLRAPMSSSFVPVVGYPIPTIPLVVVGAYFHGEVDPQRAMTYTPTCVEYFRGWYESLHKCGIHGVLMHNGLNESVVRKMETDTFKFVLVDKSQYSTKMHPNEWRMLALLDLVRNHSEWEYVMSTDVRDVRFNRNPVEMMRSITDRDIFFSWEVKPGWWWVHKTWKECEGIDRTDEQKKLYAVGVFGGKQEAMILHLEMVARHLIRMAGRTGNSTRAVCDMIAHNIPIYDFWIGNSTVHQGRMWDGDDSHPLFSINLIPDQEKRYSVVHKRRQSLACHKYAGFYSAHHPILPPRVTRDIEEKPQEKNLAV
ncbi:hypothetical protein Pelo_15114 [Pelomyxa schiedti]|nr:hypothetical protein Pelo_15114 [Pelomyxa schiedti]